MATSLRQRWVSYLLRRRGLSPETVQTYEHMVRHVERFLGKDLSEITRSPSEVEVYLTLSEDPPGTKTVALAAVKSYHRFECVTLNVPPNGIMAIPGMRVRRRSVPHLGLGQVAFLLEAASEDPVDCRLIYLGCYAGTRIAEACDGQEGERLGILDWTDGRLVIFGKGRKVREVPVHPELAARRDLILSEPVTNKRRLEYRCQRLASEAGFHFTSHYLRAAFARRLEDLGIAHRVTQELLGHSGDVTSSYTGGVPWRRKVEAIHTLTWEASSGQESHR